MPIIEGTDGAYVVVFGAGDIPILVGHLPNDPKTGAIELMESREKYPIGSEIPGMDKLIGCSSEEAGFKPGVRLVFHDLASVDVLIESLQEVRENMAQGKAFKRPERIPPRRGRHG